MPHQPRPDTPDSVPNDWDLAFRTIRRNRGNCPPAGDLVDYAAGMLAADESEKVQIHVAECGRCDLALERLRSFRRQGAASRWASSPSGKLLAVFSFIAFVVLGFVGYRSWNSPPPLVLKTVAASVPPTGLGPALNVSLGRDVRGGAIKVTEIDHGEPYVLFSFWAPIDSAETQTASVEQDGRVVLPPRAFHAADSVGNCLLVCPRVNLSKGRQELIVRSYDRSGHLSHEFRYPFVV